MSKYQRNHWKDVFDRARGAFKSSLEDARDKLSRELPKYVLESYVHGSITSELESRAANFELYGLELDGDEKGRLEESRLKFLEAAYNSVRAEYNVFVGILGKEQTFKLMEQDFQSKGQGFHEFGGGELTKRQRAAARNLSFLRSVFSGMSFDETLSEYPVLEI